jgi:hypothetical protein
MDKKMVILAEKCLKMAFFALNTLFCLKSAQKCHFSLKMSQNPSKTPFFTSKTPF